MDNKISEKDLKTLRESMGQLGNLERTIGINEVKKIGMIAEINKLRTIIERTQNRIKNKHGRDKVFNLSDGSISGAPLSEKPAADEQIKS